MATKTPLPIHSQIVDKEGRPTQAIVRYLVDLEKRLAAAEAQIVVLTP